jgi:hypothetical protein
MGGRAVARRLLEVVVLVCPLAIGLLVPSRLLPRPLAFVLANGWWLVAAGIGATLLAVALPPFRTSGAAGRAASWAVHGRRAWPTLFVAGLLVAVLGLPGWRQVGPAGGDEPKYLRIARSLYRDLDADVSSNQEGALTAAGLARNAQRLARSTTGAFASLLRGEHPPPDHAWSLGNWTVAAWHGGEYHVQGPGLPALLAPVVGFRASEEPWPTIPRGALTVMALAFALAFVQAALLAGDLSGSRPMGALAASLVVLSPAVFVGGYHLYPDAVAVAAVPWLARHAWAGGPPLRPARVAALGLVAGGLVWLHVKLLLFGAASTMLLGLRLRWSRSLALLAASALGPVAAWLLFQHRLTGLLRPDALYVRFGSEVWRGASEDLAWRFVGGLGNALFGARDGIFVMVPVVAVASLGLPWLWRQDRQAVVVLAALFAALWWAAALHGGGAPGPPGRLLSPAAPLLAAPLAVALRHLRGLLAFRWSLAAAVIVSLVVVAAMGANPRRTLNPYRGVTADADLTRDLPAGRSNPVGATLDLARASLLLVAVGYWAWRFSREVRTASPESPASAPSRALGVWREAVAFHLGVWLTLAATATALHVLTALAGG